MDPFTKHLNEFLDTNDKAFRKYLNKRLNAKVENKKKEINPLLSYPQPWIDTCATNNSSFMPLYDKVLQHKYPVSNKILGIDKYRTELEATVIAFRRVNNYKTSELEEQDACSPNFILKRNWKKYGIISMLTPSVFIYLFSEKYKIVFYWSIYEDLYNLDKTRKCSHNFINELNEYNKGQKINMFIAYENNCFHFSSNQALLKQIYLDKPETTINNANY